MQIISEGPVKITKLTIEAAWRRRAPGLRLIVRDSGCRGLALIVNPTTMSWTYAYRPRGTDPYTGRRWPNRTVTIGNPASHSPEDARRGVNQIKGEAAAGGDPVASRKIKRAAERRKRGATLGRLLDEYERALPNRPKLRGAGLPTPKHVKEELMHARAAITMMTAEATPLAELDSASIRGMLAATAGRPATARARFGALSRFLDWCQDSGQIEVNPCALVARSRRPTAPEARSHYLTVEELAHLWRAAGKLRGPVWRDLARFLIAVPCRRGEAARLDWSHLDLAAAEWRQPARLTKNRDPHRLHLHPLALSILNARHEAAERRKAGLVFPAPESAKAVDTFTDLKLALSARGGVSGWTWHDFRRSFATSLGEAGFPEAVADAVLNHRQSATRGGVLGVYQRASRWPEQVRAMQLWGRLLADAIERREMGPHVIPLAPAVAG